MKVYRGNGLGDIYYSLLRDITEFGRRIVTRGHQCLELSEPVTLVYEKPGYCWMTIPGRKFNPFFALAEVAWILTGNGNVEWISYFNSRMKQFSDGGENFHGAYGLRMRHWGSGTGGAVDQIQEVVRKLREDSFSRQAVVSLWDPVGDNKIKSSDIPCNNLVYYTLRNGKLDQTVTMRSNDLVWGTPYNAVQLTHLHALVAGMLGVEMGTFTYIINNLHYYFNLYKTTLSGLLEKAYESDAEKSGLKAVSIPSFGTVDDEGIHLLEKNCAFIAKNYQGIYSTNLDLMCPYFTGGGYWNQIIPQMIWIYTVLKEKNFSNSGIVDHISERVMMLGSTLIELILDFYQDSESVYTQAVMTQCQKAILVRTSVAD